jgi:hypothetical protein
MLVTFRCDAHENVVMFGQIAKRLLVLMGHSGTVPSAILPADLPTALRRLNEGLAAEKQQQEEAARRDDDEPEVSLRHRALPLIGLLEDAIKAGRPVVWSD